MSTRIDLVINQGETFVYEVNLVDSNQEALNVTGFTANAQIRRAFTSNVATEFAVTLVTGLMRLELTADQTAALQADRHVYDVYLTKAPDTKRVMEGIASVKARVTR